jgi:SAM-dependent methyltransferase
MQKMATEADQEVRPKARDTIHYDIIEWFRDKKRGSVLDAPAGFGHLSLRLTEMGFQVVCGEIEPEIFRVKDLTCTFTDLNRHIDAPDESFDYVCCVDGLEHMTDPYQAVKEFSRVLRRGGYGIFSVPNYTNIEKRMKYLLNGYLTKPVGMERYRKQGSLFNFHNSPLTITILEFMFSINGLEIVEIRKNAPKNKQYLLLPLVAVIKFANLFGSRRHREKHRTDLTLHPNVILGGNNIICITRKSTTIK